MLDCANCAHFDRRTKTCNGLNKICFEYDEKTQTIIDGITKMPRKVQEEIMEKLKAFWDIIAPYISGGLMGGIVTMIILPFK